jgi:hypothetical protein
VVDDDRAAQWEQDARTLLARFYGTGTPVAHMAAVVLALLRDREDLLHYAERIAGSRAAERACGE